MKFILIPFLLFLASCSQKKVQTTPVEPGVTVHNDGKSFLKECSQIRVVDEDRWLLTCQKEPHEDRTEIYDWSFSTQKLKRITYQDGQIWDIAPIDQSQFYYASSYDEFKEQFVSILSGAQAGSDIYIKDRKETNFTRLTTDQGLEFSFFWAPLRKTLYYVLQTPERSQIKTLDAKRKITTVYTAPQKKIINPVWNDKKSTLYWVEYNNQDNNARLISMGKNRKLNPLYTSASKIFQIGSSPQNESLLIGFATGVGVEIWNLNLSSNCWNLAYRNADPVSEFYPMNENTLFITVKNSLKEVNFLKVEEICHPSPPGLGVIAP